MNTRSTNSPKELVLYGCLQKARKAGVVAVSVDAARLNHPGSPVWDPGENVVPLLAMLLISVLLIFTVNLIVGTAVMTLSVFFYSIFLRPWILQRVNQRTVEAATSNVHNWNLLWKKGGLAVTLNGATRVRCLSPTGDWRVFVTRYLPWETDTAELYNAFRRADKGDGDVKGALNLDM